MVHSENERLARIESCLEQMKMDIHELRAGQTELNAVANQGKGALRTLLWLGGGAGMLVGGLYWLFESLPRQG